MEKESARSRRRRSVFGLGALIATLAWLPAHAEPRPAIDAAVGGKSGAGRIGASAWFTVFRPGRRWELGVGIRTSFRFGSATEFDARGGADETAPSKLSIDPSVYALNLAVFGEVRLAPRVALGANLDLIGIAGGSSRAAGSFAVRPERFSYFAYGTRDHGALDSEYYLAVRIDGRLHLRAGVSHYVTNLFATGPGPTDATYQRFETVPFVALAWRP